MEIFFKIALISIPYMVSAHAMAPGASIWQHVCMYSSAWIAASVTVKVLGGV